MDLLKLTHFLKINQKFQKIIKNDNHSIWNFKWIKMENILIVSIKIQN